MLYISHLLEDEAMKRLIRETGMGVESIEFSIADNLDQLEQKIEEYDFRLTRMALTLHGPFLDLNPAAFDSLVQSATMTRYEQCYQAARRLGAKKIIFHSCFVPSVYFLEGWAVRVAEFFDRFLADKTDEIQILMENVLDPFPQPLREVAERVKHPAFGLCLDVGHAHCYSEIQCEEWIRVLAPYIRHLHIHDNRGDADSHLALGHGTIRQKEILALLDAGIDGTIECCTAEDVMQTYRICAGR